MTKPKRKLTKASMLSLLLLPLVMGINPKAQETPRRIMFDERVLNSFSYLYDGLERELPLCMKGLVVNDLYLIYDVTIPLYLKSEDNMSEFDLDSCKHKDYIGIAHYHHSGKCRPSEGDIKRFEADINAKIETIVCPGVERYGDDIDFFNLTKEQLADYKEKYGYES